MKAHLSGLRQAMENVTRGTTPDHAKWTGVNSFVRRYSDLAGLYISLTGDPGVATYDVNNLRSPHDMVWPDQKAIFDQIFMDVLILDNLIAQKSNVSFGPMYNLFVSGNGQEWTGKPFQIELTRCISEYTNPNLSLRLGKLDPASIGELKRLPCIFAYESGHKLPPKFGFIKDIVIRQGEVRIEYEIQHVEPFLTAEDLEQMTFELDIGKLELYRTHWAVKDVNLPKELHSKGILIPASLRDIANAVDVSKHIFDVALSFPGEARPLVEKIVQELERRLGPNRYFYDNNYVSQLAQPSLDTLLQGIYRRAKLDVVFLSADYQKKNWCGVEFRAIKDIVFDREFNRVMFIKAGEGSVDGVFNTDGYIDASKFEPNKIAEFILERLRLLDMNHTS
ncbi:TIR domain-containing protein [Mucilaginibacter endophyticus]|uniref:TIR domain-containing protein n=1 Tax=Mucilaginibacter endophyticus TaxID=2675003 RepID=UPI00244C7B22|nr:TIR domain-containing protein [Mucilaginibacter endophyticus]